MDSSGNLLSENRYMPFGETRTISGTTKITETDFGYTGQRDYSDDFGLMDYKARFYSPALGRFTQPDTVVPEPGSSQAWNRYTYSSNNPINRNDPSGHEDDDPGNPPDGDNLLKRLFANLASEIIESANEIGNAIADMPGKMPSIKVPVVIPKNISNIDEAGSIVNYTISAKSIRTAGRTVGDISAGPLFAIGYAATVGPEVIDNIKTGASISEFQADLTVDTIGFGLSELAGIGTGALAVVGFEGNPLAIVGGKISGDVIFGTAYENWVENHDIRGLVKEMYELDYPKCPYEPLPIPTPNSNKPKPTGTQVPK